MINYTRTEEGISINISESGPIEYGYIYWVMDQSAMTGGGYNWNTQQLLFDAYNKVKELQFKHPHFIYGKD